MKTFILSILCLAFIASHAQTTVFDFKPTVRKPKNVLTAVDDSTGNLYLTLVGKDSVSCYTFDPAWNIKNRFAASRDNDGDKGLAGDRFDNMKMIAYQGNVYGMYNSGKRELSIDKLDRSTSEEIKTHVITVNKREVLVGYYSVANIFGYITADKDDTKMNIITTAKRGGLLFDTIGIKLDSNDPSLSASDILNKAGLIGPDEKAIDEVSPVVKIYYTKEKVYLSIDRRAGTLITEADLKTGKIQSKTFKQTLVAMDEYTKQNDAQGYTDKSVNSFFYGNNVVTGSVVDKSLAISFYNYETGNLIKTYTINKADALPSIANDSIISIGEGAIAGPHDGTISTKKFINRASGGLAFTLENSDSGRLLLEVESYNFVGRGGGTGFAMGANGMMTQTGGGMVGRSMTKDSYFNCLFQPDSIEHIITKLGVKNIDEMVTPAQNLGRDGLTNVFRWNGVLYMAFYYPKTEGYAVQKLTEVPRD